MKYIVFIIGLLFIVACQPHEQVQTTTTPEPVQVFFGERAQEQQQDITYVSIDINDASHWPDPFTLEGADLFNVELTNRYTEEIFFHISPIGVEGVMQPSTSIRALMSPGDYVLQVIPEEKEDDNDDDSDDEDEN